MLVRLTRKLAQRIDGIDLRRCAVGEIVDLPDREALSLIAEAWAVLYDGTDVVTAPPARGVIQPARNRRRRARTR